MTNDDEKRVAAQVALGKKREFSDEEFEALQSISRAWLAAQVVGRAAAMLQTVVKWVGWAVALYIGIKLGVVDWIRGIK